MERKHFTLQMRVSIAKNFCAKTANMKDWQVRNKHNRAMREIARELMRGKGYIVATSQEMEAMYGQLFHVAGACLDQKKCVWGLDYNDIFNKIQFVKI